MLPLNFRDWIRRLHSPAKPVRRHSHRLSVTRLEDRTVPTQYTWQATAAGPFNWTDATQWFNATTGTTNSGYPNAVGDVALINDTLAGAETISLGAAITVGTLTVGDAGGAHSFTIIPGTGGSLTFNAGASASPALNLNDTVAAPVSISSNITLGGGLTVQAVGAGTATLGGTITGAQSLTSSGSGTLLLNGNDSYSGGTTVTAGTLGGTGTIGAVTVNAGATLEAGSGASSVGTLNVGALTFGTASGSSVATFAAQINGVTAGTQFDQVVAGGAINLNNATLSITAGAGLSNNTYTLIKNTPGTAINGTFAGLPQNAIITANGYAFQITYTGGAGHDVQLSNLGLAKTYYVSPTFTGATGSTVNNAYTDNTTATIGTNAFTTISSAISQAAAGSTIVVNTGTYTETDTESNAVNFVFQGGAVAIKQFKDTSSANDKLTIGTDFSSNPITLTLGAGTSLPSTLYGTITGPGGLTIGGAEGGTKVVTLSGANSFAGGLTVNTAGTSGGVTVGSATAIPTNAAITVDSGSIFNVGQYSFAIGSLNGAGTVVDSSATNATLTFGTGNANASLSGVTLSNTGAGLLGIAKIGTGTLTVGSGTNTSSGGTTVTGGLLKFTSGYVSEIGTGPISVSTGAVVDVDGQTVAASSLTLAGGTVIGTGGGTFSLSTTGTAVTISGNYVNTTPAVANGVTLAFTGTSGGNIVKSSNGANDFVVIAANLNLGSVNRTIALQDTSGDGLELALTGPITGTGGLTLNNGVNSSGFPDYGTLGVDNLTSTPSTLGGGLTVTDGRYIAETADALGTTSNPISIGASGGLSLATTTATTFPNPITITGTGNSATTYQYNLSDLSGNNTLSGPISLSGGATVGISVANGQTLTVSGNITQTGGTGSVSTATDVLPSSIVPAATAATGTLILSGSNSYAGPTTSGTAGSETVVVGSATAIPSGTVLTVNGNSVFQLNGFNTTVGSVAGSGAIQNGGSTPATLSTGSLNATTSLTGMLSDGTGGGAFALVQTGTGTLTLAGNNLYSGGTTIPAGKVVLGRQTSVGSGSVVLSGGTLAVSGSSVGAGLEEGYIYNNNFDQTDPNPGNGISPVYSFRTGETSGVTNNNTGTPLSLTQPWCSNETWVYDGEFYTADGSVAFAKNVDDNTLLKIDGVTYINSTAWNVPTTTGRLQLTPGWHQIEVRFGNGGGGAGAVPGNGWTNNFGFGMSTDTSTGWANIAPGETVGVGGNGITNQPSPYVATPQGTDYNFENSANQDATQVGPTDPGNGSLFRQGFDLSNNIVLSSPASRIEIDGGASAIASFDGTVSGSAPLTKTGTGQLNLTGQNTYTGGTTVSAGTIDAGSSAALGAAAAVSVTTSAALQLAGNNLTIGSLSGAGTVTNAGTTSATLTSGGLNATTTFSGTFADGVLASGMSAPLSFTETGSGSLTLSGANTLNGNVVFSSGTTTLAPVPGGSPNFSSLSGTITVTGGTLAGSGTISESVVGTSSVLSPGNGSTPAVLTVNDLLTLGANSTFSPLIVASPSGGAGTAYSQVVASAGVSLNGAILNPTVSANYHPASGDSFTIISNSSGNSVTGTFDGLPQGGVVALGGALFQISYTGNGGNDVTLTAVTPGTPAVVTVDPSYNSSTSGFGTTKFKSVNAALAAVGDYGTVQVDPGNYAEDVSITPRSDGAIVLLQVQAGATSFNSLASSDPGSPIALSSGSILTTGSDGHSTSVLSSISGSGGLVKAGGGTMTLDGGDTYTGTTEVSGGILQAGSGEALSSSTALKVDSSGDFRLNGFDITVGSLSGAAGGIVEDSSFSSQATLTVGTNNTSTTFAGTFQDGFNGISLPLSLALESSGTMTLTGSNTFSGGTTVTGGTISVPVIGTSTGPFGLGSVALVNAALNYTGSGESNFRNFSLSGTTSISVPGPAGDILSLGGALSGTSNLTKTGSGTLLLDGGTSSVIGSTTVSAGNLQLGDGSNAGEAGNGTITVAAPATLTLDEPGSISFPTVLSNPIVDSGSITTTGPGVTTLSGAISGGGPVTASGSGTVIVAASNSYSGGTTIQSGTVQLQPSSSLGSQTITLDGGVLSTAVSLGNSVVIPAHDTAGIAVSTSAAFGPLSLATGSTLNVTSASSTVTYSLNFGATKIAGTTTAIPTIAVTNPTSSGTGTVTLGALNDGGSASGLTVAGNGTLTLSAAATSLVAGTAIGVTGTSTLVTGAVGAIGNAAAVSVASGSTFDLNGVSQTIAGLTGAGVVEDANTLPATLTTAAPTGVSTFSGALEDGTGGGSLAVTEAGPGTEILSGANTYSGPTTLNGGYLAVYGPNGTLAAASTVTVGSAATLSGDGTVAGTVNVSGTLATADHTFSPGPGGEGVLSTGPVNFASGSNFDVAIVTDTPGSGGYSQVNSTGAVNLGQGIANLVPTASTYTPNSSDSFTIVTAAGGVSGFFNGYPNGSTVTANGNSFTINYGSSNVVLTPVAQTLTPPTVTADPVINNNGIYLDSNGGLVTSNTAGTVNYVNNPQRSLVTSLSFSFSGPVTLAPGAFTLTRQSDGVAITDTDQITVSNPLNDHTNYVLTFADGASPIVQSGSLADGLYVLNVNHTKVTAGTSGTGPTMTADYNSPTSGPDRIYRLFGDFNGDGSVNGADFANFASTYNSGPNDPNYQGYLDYSNSTNGINSADFTQFSDRYGTSI